MDIAGVLARVRFDCCAPKEPFCSFENLLKRKVPLDSSREIMQFGLLICLVWSSDGFPITFQNYPNLAYLIISSFSFLFGCDKCQAFTR